MTLLLVYIIINRVSEAYKRITDPDSFKDEEEDMNFDDLNNMFCAMFADMMGGGLSGSGGMPIDFLEMILGGGLEMMFEDDDGYDERDFMRMRGMGGGGYLDCSDEDEYSDEDDDMDEEAARRAYMAGFMNDNDDVDYEDGVPMGFEEMLMGSMMMGGGMMEEMMGAALFGGGGLEDMMNLMEGGPPLPPHKRRGNKNVETKSHDKLRSNDKKNDDGWETASDSDNSEKEQLRKQKKAMKNKAKKKKAKAKKGNYYILF